jgi:hypothetical protein
MTTEEGMSIMEEMQSGESEQTFGDEIDCFLSRHVLTEIGVAVTVDV